MNVLDECSAEAGCVCEEHENCLCPYCLDEAIARVCPYCRASLEPGEICDCKSKCVWCGYNPCKCCSVCLAYPCRCSYTICQYCLLSPCQCLSDCPICRPGLCSKCKDCGNHYCWEDHGGTGGSGGSSGGSVGLDNPFLPDTAVVNMNNFVDRIFDAAFKSKVYSELGVNPDHVTIVLDSKIRHTSGANASYLFKDNTLNIFPHLFDCDYTSTDMRSIMYHEYVHAKQFLIDGIVLPLDKDGYIVKSKYYIPITLEDVEEAWDEFYVILETNGISKNASERNVEEEQAYQFYKSFKVDPMVHDYENGGVKTLEYNKDALKMELEAYSRQLRQYSLEMSNECRNQMLESYYTTLESLNLIKNL